jgi:hypothetical protein
MASKKTKNEANSPSKAIGAEKVRWGVALAGVPGRRIPTVLEKPSGRDRARHTSATTRRTRARYLVERSGGSRRSA